MTTKIDQKEYLKKYLSGDKKKKKKKDKSSKTGKNVKIVDDDVDVSKFHQLGEDEDPYQLGEDAPQIVGVIDDRPPELRAKEDFTNNSKWKVLEDIEKSPIRKRDSSPWGKKENRSDYSPPRRNNKTPDISPKRRSPDLSPPRQRKRSPDLSPPRQKRRSHDLSPPRQKRRSPNISPRRPKNRAIDQSPPRQKRRSREMSPPRKRITSDQSPSRKRRSPNRSPSRQKGKPRDLTPPRQRKSSDISPPPRQRRNRTPELSPVRVKKERDNGSSDLSPARRRQNRTPDISPQRYRKAKSPDFNSQRKGNRAFDHPQKRNRTPDLPPGRIKSERISRSPDLSPRGARQNRSPDLSHHSRKDRSPKRKERSNRSPQRRKSRDLSPRLRSVDLFTSNRPTTGIKIERISRTPELSPQIIQRNGSPIPIKQERSADTSPPIRKKRTPEKRSRWDKREDSRDRSPQRSKSTEKTEKMTKTLDGKAAGLQDAKALRIENDKFKKSENEVFDKMSTEMSGRYAETVVREKSGKRKDIEKEIREEMEKKKKHEQRKEVYTRWNKGVKQTEEYKKKLDEAAHEMDKPMARYSNDVDLENHFKKQDRVGDTMLGYMRTKKKEKDRKAGVPERPLYKGMFPNNRYNIRPGYRWDGVDRSSGYEKKWFEMQSNKKAVAEEAYKYSVEDM